jgi:energy-coupling factor transporter ATP-binding protein EcfA2
LNYKVASRYEKFKAKNIRMNIKNEESRSKHVLVSVRDLSLGYDRPLFSDINIDLREGEALELRGRNGAGKTTLIKALLGANDENNIKIFDGEIAIDKHMRIGVYEQEVNTGYFDLQYLKTFKTERNFITNFTNKLKVTKGIGLIYNTGVYTWVLLILIGYTLYKKRYTNLIFSIPILLTLKYALTGDKKQNASVKSIGIENIKFVYLFLYNV